MMRTRPNFFASIPVSAVLTLTLAACSGGSGDAEHELGDGTVVEVTDGALALRAGDRTLLATPPEMGPQAHTFDETIRMASGFWQFLRRNIETRSAATFVGSERTDDAVVLQYAGEGEVEATVTVSVEEPEVSTRIALEMTGVEDAGSAALPLVCDPEAGFLGFGAQYNATDQRGEAFPLWVQEQGIGRTGGTPPPPFVGNAHTSYMPMPLWVDPRGFGVLVDTNARVLVDLCKEDPDVAWIEVDRSTRVELVVFHGPTPADVVRQIGDRLGRPSAPPSWAYGPWIGIQGGRDAVLGEADALEAAEVPVTALWAQDWVGKREFGAGNVGVKYRWIADEELYPDLAGMIDELRSRDIRFLGYANPFVPTDLDHYEPMREMGLLIGDPESDEPYLVGTPNGNASMPDLTNPDARAYVKGFLRDMVSEYGMDGWMADFGEWLPHDAELSDGSDAFRQHNLYPSQWHRLSREVMQEERPDGDSAIFTRSGWTGEQGVARIVWIGDQEANWMPTDGLPTVVPALLNLGLSGVPFVTHDIAGFSGGPSTKELYMRWTELGAFTTVMRTHEGIRRDENWNWDADEETTAHFRRFARIHRALVPELEELAAEAETSSMPPMRHLALEFPDDAGSRTVSDQYMLGETLLVAPVVTEGAKRREVYLPPGEWFHVWSGDSHEGGRTIEVDAPLGEPPVFSRGEDREDLRAL